MPSPIPSARERLRSVDQIAALHDPFSTPHDVALVRWPEEHSIRECLDALQRPRVLLVDRGTTPPAIAVGLEDWLWWPPDPEELVHRVRRLSGPDAQLSVESLYLDEDGLLRLGDRWVAISPGHEPVMALFLRNPGRVVSFEEIVATYEAGGGSGHRPTVRTALLRLSGRIQELGFELVSVRRRGLMLCVRALPSTPDP